MQFRNRIKPAFAGRAFASRSARVLQTLIVAILVCISLGATDSTERFNKLGGKLTCTCGCAQMLLGCDHVGCPNRGDEMDLLRSGIASGLSDAAILQNFVQEYGIVVLAAPPAKGFNLVAWIMPFAVSALALAGTILLVRNWVKQQPKLASADGLQTDAAQINSVQINPVQIGAEAQMRDRIRRETGTDGEM